MVGALLHDCLSSMAAWLASSALLHGRSLTPVAGDIFFAAVGVGRTTVVGRDGQWAK
ncbi:tail protein [Sesbania bispinosa]|nr:tail protein [Sesbania bispinosa]